MDACVWGICFFKSVSALESFLPCDELERQGPAAAGGESQRSVEALSFQLLSESVMVTSSPSNWVGRAPQFCRALGPLPSSWPLSLIMADVRAGGSCTFGCFRDGGKREGPKGAEQATFHFSFWDPRKQALY